MERLQDYIITIISIYTRNIDKNVYTYTGASSLTVSETLEKRKNIKVLQWIKSQGDWTKKYVIASNTRKSPHSSQKTKEVMKRNCCSMHSLLARMLQLKQNARGVEIPNSPLLSAMLIFSTWQIPYITPPSPPIRMWQHLTVYMNDRMLKHVQNGCSCCLLLLGFSWGITSKHSTFHDYSSSMTILSLFKQSGSKQDTVKRISTGRFITDILFVKAHVGQYKLVYIT